MTIRAVILGLLAAVFIAAVTYINDHVLLLTHLVASHMPIFVFGSLIAAVILINPILYLLRRRWRLRPAELAFSTMLMLVVCNIPGYGLLGVFFKGLSMPANVYQNEAGWKKHNLLGYIPPHLLPAEGKYVPEFTGTIYQGMRSQDTNVSLGEVPWKYWAEPLTAWMPLIVLMAVAVICLGLILHRQWTVAERLRYPIADVASTFFEQDPERAAPPLLRNRIFWWGLGIVLFVRIVNGIYHWYPDKSVSIPLSFSFHSIANEYPIIMQADQWWYFTLMPTIYPTVIAIAFMLAAEVSFSLAIAPLVFPVVSIIIFRMVDVEIGQDDYMRGGPSAWQRFGSYLAMAVMIAYTGRRYYWDVLKGAMTFRGIAGVQSYAVWACRFFMVSVLMLIVLLTGLGLDWPFAILIVGLFLLTFLGMSRINCETGLFLGLPRWQALGILLGLFGSAAMGPQVIIIVGILCVIFTMAPWESLMPFFMNGLRMCTNQRIRPGRVGASAMSIYLLGLVVAVPVMVWAIHNYGVLREGWRWSTWTLPRYYYEATDKSVIELDNAGKLSQSESFTPMERLDPHNWDYDSKFLWAAGLGVGVVLVVSFMRLRFPWWPLHPVIFMVWGTRQMAELSASFMLGWGIKSIVTNLGGTQTYRAAKNLMFGAIAGDLTGGLIFMAIGVVYRQLTGTQPPIYRIFPVMN